MPEVQARRVLAGRTVRFVVLSPLGPFAGRGTLRVLRARPNSSDDSCVELVCGYESYERLDAMNARAQ